MRSLNLLALAPLALTLAACGATAETPAAAGDGPNAAAKDPLDEVLQASGTGTQGSWDAYERADYSCTTSGGSYGIDACYVDFSLAQDESGGLTVTFEEYWPNHDWVTEDLVGVLRGQTEHIDAFSTATGSAGSGSRTWDWTLTLDEDGLTIDIEGVYDTLSRCGGEELLHGGTAVYSHDDLLVTADLAEGDLVVQAGAYAWLARGSGSRWGYSTEPDAFHGSNPALNHTGDSVALVAEGVVLDVIPEVEPDRGISWQLDLDSGLWCASSAALDGDFGTPGAANDSCL